ncbi:hypothetical protein EMIT0P253_340025 [Pseudomonas sp. IT-P253]
MLPDTPQRGIRGQVGSPHRSLLQDRVEERALYAPFFYGRRLAILGLSRAAVRAGCRAGNHR